MRCKDCQRPEKFWARRCSSEDGIHTFHYKNNILRAGTPPDWDDKRREQFDLLVRSCIAANQITQSKMFKRMRKYGQV